MEVRRRGRRMEKPWHGTHTNIQIHCRHSTSISNTGRTGCPKPTPSLACSLNWTTQGPKNSYLTPAVSLSSTNKYCIPFYSTVVLRLVDYNYYYSRGESATTATLTAATTLSVRTGSSSESSFSTFPPAKMLCG